MTAEKEGARKVRVKPEQINVAEYIKRQMEIVGKKQTELANDIGFAKPNMLSMIKTGSTKVPMQKIVPLAKALGIDKVFLFRKIMMEYQPETWTAIEEIFGNNLITQNEAEIIETVREVSDLDPKIRTEHDRQLIRDAVGKLTAG